MKQLTEKIYQIIITLRNGTAKRIDTETDDYRIKAYLVQDVIRIDLKQKR